MELSQVAESKRLCSLIYLYASIDGVTPLSSVIQDLTARCIELLVSLPSKAALNFPLFVVGTMGVCSEADRRVVLGKFDAIIQARWMASVARARDVVIQVWLDRDLGKGGRWEDLVETKGRMLSLA